MPKRLLYLIITATVLRILVASVLELSNDEVYYYLYALDLQPNYFDHPPAVGVLIWLSTLDLHWVNELSIRLGAIACSALGTFIIYHLGTTIKDEQTGWLAALLYNSSIYASLIAGTFIIPDSPQIVCWLSALWFMLGILQRAQNGEHVSISLWVMFGFFAGLTVLCKVHGVFLWVGLGLYIIKYERKLFKAGGLYLAAVITLCVVSPIIWWNVANDFITYRFHSGRVTVQESLFHPDYFFQALGGQIIYNNPVNAGLMIVSLWKLRSVEFLDKLAARFVIANGMPLIIVVTVMSLFNSMLPHWSGPAFVVLTLLPAAYLREKAMIFIPRVVGISMGLILVAMATAIILIKSYPGTIGSKEESNYGQDDFTLDLSGWKQFANDFTPWLKEQEAAGVIEPDLSIVIHKWFPGAHIEYYVARPLGKPVIGVGQWLDLHQYFWLNKRRPELKSGDNALCIVPSNYPMYMDQNLFRNFSSFELLRSFSSMRGGQSARRFDVYLMKDYLKNDEVHEAAASNR